METDRAIKLLDVKLQNPLRMLAARKLQQILNSNTKTQRYTEKTSVHSEQYKSQTCNGKCNDGSRR
jgi:hypothetical protein